MSLQTVRARRVAFMQARNPRFDLSANTLFDDFGSQFDEGIVDIERKLAQVAQQAFLGTATGPALTAKALDYGVTRIGAVAAQGLVQFSRQQAIATAVVVPAGTIVQTVPAPGSPPIQYQTQAAATILANQTASNAVTAIALVPGQAGNAAVGTVISMPTFPQGVTAVTNTGAMASGADPETDDALRIRVLTGLVPASTVGQLIAAVKAVPGVFDAAIQDPQDGLGDYTCYACDATGALSGPLASAVATALAQVDGIGLTRHVNPMGVVGQGVAVTISVDPTYTQASVVAAVQAALASYVGGLRSGTALRPWDLYRVVMGMLPNTTQVAGLTNFAVTTPPTVVAPTAYQLVRFLPPPPAPTLSASGTGNTLPAGTYWVLLQDVYTTAVGQTGPGPEGSQVVAAGQALTIGRGSFPAGVTSVNVYVGTAQGGETFQGQITASGGTLVLAAPLAAGAPAPTSPVLVTVV